MDEKPPPLSYARPMEKEFSPPMYVLVWTVLMAAGLVLVGAFALATFGVVFFQTDAQLLSVAPLLVAVVFLYIGIRSLTVAIRFLRGHAPQPNWERWLFWIWIWRN